MKNLKYLLVFGIAVLAALPFSLFSQDIHFSQFYASPLTLNSALTGKMNGDYRLEAIYRNQWNSIQFPFVTPSASFDMPFVLGKKGTNAVGVGVVFVSDKSNDKNVKKLTFMISAAYHKALGNDKSQQLSLGIQGGYVQTTVNYLAFSYGHEWNGKEFDNVNSTPPQGISGDNVSYPDFNVGLFYSGKIVKKLHIYAGYSLFHFTRPKENITATDFRLPMRHVAHGGLEAGLTDRLSLLPGVIYMYQGNADELNFGTNLGYKISQAPGKEVTGYLGIWYRWDDAVIPMVAMEFLERLRVGFSYDVTTSSLSTVNNNKGGFEISAIYVGNIVRIKESNLFCPRF